MRRGHWISAGILLLALLGLLGGIYATRDSAPPESLLTRLRNRHTKTTQPPPKERTIDTLPLLTARRLGALAVSVEEQELARQAEKLANHELDQAFASALRQAAEAPPLATQEAKELAQAKGKAEDALEADQKALKVLSARLAKAPESEKDALEDQIEVAKAQLELDQDDLDATAEDLDRAGGDPQARIKRLKEAHEALDKEPLLLGQAASSLAPQGSLLQRFRYWKLQREKVAQLAQARQAIQTKLQRMTTRQQDLSRQVKTESQEKHEVKQEARGFAREGTQYEGTTSLEEKKATLDSLKHFMATQHRLTILNKRIQDFQNLDEVYDNWSQLAATYLRGSSHTLLKGFISILAVLIGIFLLDRLVERVFHGMSKERLRAATLQAVVKFAILVVGLIIILFTVVGLPGNVTTILGLAGAGLTVALKDFIVAFFGWFVLMGKNGLRVGDWVEIKGVGGEVVEVGLLRTVLMETGSWDDLGHPTGRKVAFVNSFAVEGHFFNFSTAGQWMWDELRMVIPTGTDPYPIIEGIQKLVEEKTEANAKLAEEEWRKATTRYRVRTFSAVPGLNVIPTALGVEIRVRYITRAYERHNTRKGLNQAIVALMHGRSAPQETSPEAGA